MCEAVGECAVSPWYLGYHQGCLGGAARDLTRFPGGWGECVIVATGTVNITISRIAHIFNQY